MTPVLLYYHHFIYPCVSYISPYHISLYFLLAGKFYFIKSLLILLLRLLIFLLFYPARSAIQKHRHVNDTEVAIMMLNRPTHYRAASS